MVDRKALQTSKEAVVHLMNCRAEVRANCGTCRAAMGHLRSYPLHAVMIGAAALARWILHDVPADAKVCRKPSRRKEPKR